MLYHQNATVPVKFAGRLPEALAQVHNCDDLASQVDNPFHVCRRVRYNRDFRYAHDFMERTDRNAVRLLPHFETHDMRFLAHGSVHL